MDCKQKERGPMKNKILKTMLAGLLVMTCVFSCVTNVYATDDIDKQKEETQRALDDANKRKSDAESDVSNLERETDKLESDYDSLYKRLSSINSQIANANKTIANTESEIAELERELEEAKKNEDIQYDAMKKRMVYFYEHRDENNIFVALLTSGSIADFLSRASMISEIVNYDRQLLESYQQLQLTIAQKSESLNAKYEDLKTAKGLLHSSQSEMDSLLNGTSAELNEKNEELATAKMSVEEYNEIIAEMEAQMKALEAQAAAAQAAKAKEIADQLATEAEDTGGAYSASDYETQLLAATIWAEARGESYTGQLAVGSVIMNRVKSSKFPNTIPEVIMQNKQFASYPDAVNRGMALGADESCLKAAKAVIAGQRNGDWLFFMTKYYADKFGITGYTVIGNHVFFKIWGANEDTGVVESTVDPYTPTETPAPTEQTTPTETPEPSVPEESTENNTVEPDVTEQKTEPTESDTSEE